VAEPSYTDLVGHSGKTYRYWIYLIGTTLDPGPGNFCFAKEGPGGNWRPIYFGYADNLAKYVLKRGADSCIRLNDATHIMAHRTEGTRQVRIDEEADLRRLWDPICNRD
jgi:hypothetical protein